MADKDLLKDARDQFQEGEDGCANQKAQYEEDYRFSRLSEQWPLEIQQTRKQEIGRAHV